MVQPLFLLVQGFLLIDAKRKIDFPQDDSNVRKFVVHNSVTVSKERVENVCEKNEIESFDQRKHNFCNHSPSPTHGFDPPQHERLGGKTFLDLQLGNL